MNKTNLEMAKECGAEIRFNGDVIIFEGGEKLDAYISRFCAEKDAEIARLSNAVLAVICVDRQLDEATQGTNLRLKALKLADDFQFAANDWEAKKLSPLQRQVAMLHSKLQSCLAVLIRCLESDVEVPTQAWISEIKEAIYDNQAAAEAYDREHAAKVLDSVKRKIVQVKTGDFNQQSDRQIGFDVCLEILEELRAANKKESD